MSYTNADGLYVLTEGAQGVPLTQGTAPNGVKHVLVMDITLTALGTTFGASNINVNNPVIPANSYITAATLIMSTAATSAGAATLSIGTYLASGTAVAATGIDATVALTAIDAVGEVVKCDGTQANGTITVGTADVYIGAIYGTAAFTAGVGKLVIEYLKV